MKIFNIKNKQTNIYPLIFNVKHRLFRTAVCKSAHRSFTFPHTDGEPFNAVKRSKREYHYTENKVMACKSATYFTALYLSLALNAVMAYMPLGSFAPERIRLPYTAHIRFLCQRA